MSPPEAGTVRRGRRTGGRKNGEGSYDVRGDGLHRFRTTYVGPDGRVRPKQITASTLKVLRSKVKEWEAELARGLPTGNETPTVEEVVAQWLNTKVDLRANSLRDYTQSAERIKRGIGGHRVKALTDAHIQAWVNQEIRVGRAPATLRKMKAILHQVLDYADRRGYVTRNVARLVRVPKNELVDPDVYDLGQIRRLLQAARTPREPGQKGRSPSDWYCLLAVHCFTGLRPSELLGLKWQDIRWEEGVIYAQRSLEWPNGASEPRLAAMKNSYSRRPIPVPLWVLDALRAHRAAQEELRAALGDGYDDWGLVFAMTSGTRIGYPIREQMVSRAFDQLRSRAGLPALRWYNLRHSYATNLLDGGVALHVVSGLLGHASVKITADIYGARAKRNTEVASGHVARLFGAAEVAPAAALPPPTALPAVPALTAES